MLQAIIKGDVSSISAKLELKLDEYHTYINTPTLLVTLDKLPLAVWCVCNHVFTNDSIPESKAYLIYNTTKVYKNIFIKFGTVLDEYELATTTTRKIVINKASLALLMLIYNKDFRQFCNITETKREILSLVKQQLDKYIKY